MGEDVVVEEGPALDEPAGPAVALRDGEGEELAALGEDLCPAVLEGFEDPVFGDDGSEVTFNRLR